MTKEEAFALIEAKTPLTGQDITDVFACSLDELVALLIAYRDAAVPTPVSAWQTAWSILKDALEFVPLLEPVGSVIATVYGLTKL